MTPSTNILETQIGPVTVAMYQQWHGAGYEVIARNGQELERIHTNYYPSAQARYNDMVALYTAEYEDARNTTMLRYADLAGILQAEYRDAADTERSLREWLHW